MFQYEICSSRSQVEGTIHISLLSIWMCLVFLTGPIIAFHQIVDTLTQYSSLKRGAKFNILDPKKLTLLEEFLEVGLESHISILCWNKVVSPITT